VELCVNSRWGTVCGTQWDNRDAAVACRKLGFDPQETSEEWEERSGGGGEWGEEGRGEWGEEGSGGKRGVGGVGRGKEDEE